MIPHKKSMPCNESIETLPWKPRVLLSTTKHILNHNKNMPVQPVFPRCLQRSTYVHSWFYKYLCIQHRKNKCFSASTIYACKQCRPELHSIKATPSYVAAGLQKSSWIGSRHARLYICTHHKKNKCPCKWHVQVVFYLPLYIVLT